MGCTTDSISLISHSKLICSQSGSWTTTCLMALLLVSIGKLVRAGFGINRRTLEQPRLGGPCRPRPPSRIREPSNAPSQKRSEDFQTSHNNGRTQLMSSHCYPSVIGPSSFQWKSANCNDFIQPPSAGRDGRWEVDVLSHLKAARLTWDPEPHSTRYKRMKQSAQPKSVYGKALIHSQKGSHDFRQHTATQPVHLLDSW